MRIFVEEQLSFDLAFCPLKLEHRLSSCLLLGLEGGLAMSA